MSVEFGQDVRYALRLLVKSPGFTVVAVLSLALGIGANTTIFTGVKAVFLNPIPGVRDADRVVGIYTTDNRFSDANARRVAMSPLNFQDVRDQNTTVQEMAAFLPLPATMLVDGTPEQVNVQLSSASYFQVLGVDASRGRTFLPEEDQGKGAFPIAVVSHAFWTITLGSDPQVIGRTLSINSYPFTVVGVTPPAFKGTFAFANPEQIWIPLSMRDQIVPAQFRSFFEERRPLIYQVLGRLAPGTTLEQARADLAVIGDRLATEHPGDNQGRGVDIAPLTDGVIGIDQRQTITRGGAVVMGIVGLVLLIACLNLANLLLARGIARSKEIGIRVALGAGRRRLIRQLMTESLTLAALGGAVGLIFAYWGTRLLWGLRPPGLNANVLDLSMDYRVFLFTLAISIVTGVLLGALPALKGSKPDLADTLKEGSRQNTQGFHRTPLGKVLVVAEVALAVVALVGAGLFVRSMQQALAVDPGFESEQLFVVAMNTTPREYTPEQGRQFYSRVLERATGVAGVEAATISSNFPIGGGFQRTVIPEGSEFDPDRQGLLSQTNIVTPEYFETLRIPLTQGRVLTESDREDAPLVAVVNEAMARRYWPDDEPLGKRFRFIDEPEGWREVVGLVRNTTIAQIGEAPQPVVYLPLAQNYTPFATLQVRTADDPRTVMGTVNREVQALDPELALTNLTTIGEILDGAVWPRRIAAILLSIFAALALVLAAIGIYGVMSYSTSQRLQEIGIRMAIGAKTGDILRLVLGQGLAITVVGVVIGLGGAFALGRFVSSLLFGVTGFDPVTFFGVAFVLVAVALLAVYVPARRAMQVDPMVAFRAE
jgi:predicted permease